MPHTTQAYPFEWRVLEFAQQLSARLSDEPGHHSFVLMLDEAGRVRSIQSEVPAEGWHPLIRHLEAEGVSFLFYDPFDAPEYAWLQWQAVSRASMERLLGSPIQASELERRAPGRSRGPELDPPGCFPTRWGVMF